MSITLTAFFPEVLRTLQVLRSDPVIKLKTIIWHGSSYRFRKGQCRVNSMSGGDLRRTNAEDFLAEIINIAGARQLSDLWGLYHDVQVYMQERILQSLLPHWEISYLPLDIPSSTSTSIEGSRDGQHCTDCCREQGRVIEENFLEGFGYILDKLSKT